MPANKNALIRYKTIDRCLSNPYRRWTLDKLVEACSDALYEMEGITKGVSVRTVQGDIQIMRSDKLGYNAPIEVYDHKYYRYTDSNYSIMNMPLSKNDYEVMHEAMDMLRQLEDFDQFGGMADVVRRLQDQLAIGQSGRRRLVHVDSVHNLKGLKLLSPLYNYIAHEQTLRIRYQSFKLNEEQEFVLCPYLLKEFRNRWFLFGGRATDLLIFNLALDRIIDVEPVPEVAYRMNPDFDSDHFFDNVIGVSKNLHAKAHKVTFWASAEQSKYITTKPIHPSQVVLNQAPDGSTTFQIEVVINYEMYSVFMSYGPGIRLLSPQSVVDKMKEKLQAAAQAYECK